MKKILSAILILTLFLLPLTVQCSADQYYCDSNGICIKIQNTEEPSTISANKKDKSFLSKSSELVLKLILAATTVIGATVALCKWSPNGELAKSINENTRTFYNDSVSPKLKNALDKLNNICIKKSNDREKCEKNLSEFINEKLQKFSNIHLYGNKTMSENFEEFKNVLIANYKALISNDPIEETPTETNVN